MPEVLDHVQQDLIPPADRRLGRLIHFDPRSTRYQVRPLLTALNAITLQSRHWSLRYWLDQLSEGACVGFSISHEMGADPVAAAVTYAQARSIYKRAQTIDPWPGEAYEGTSVLAGMQTAAGDGYYTEYRWAGAGSGRVLEDIVQSLANLGPGVFGIAWKQGMYAPDGAGYIWPTGATAGGHAICAVGIELVFLPNAPAAEFAYLDLDRSFIVLHNSWGRFWGQDGRCKITLRSVASLMAQQGEFVIPVVRLDPHPTPQPVTYRALTSPNPRAMRLVRQASMVDWATNVVIGTWNAGAEFEMVGEAAHTDGRLFIMDDASFGAAATTGMPRLTRGINAADLENVVTPPPPPPPPPEYRYFSITGSAVFHDDHNVRGTVAQRYVAYQDAVSAGKRPCLTCKPTA